MARLSSIRQNSTQLDSADYRQLDMSYIYIASLWNTMHPEIQTLQYSQSMQASKVVPRQISPLLCSSTLHSCSLSRRHLTQQNTDSQRLDMSSIRYHLLNACSLRVSHPESFICTCMHSHMHLHNGVVKCIQFTTPLRTPSRFP